MLLRISSNLSKNYTGLSVSTSLVSAYIKSDSIGDSDASAASRGGKWELT